MAKEKRELTEALKPRIKVLILQEVRLHQLEQTLSPRFMTEELTRSIQEVKRQVSELVRLMAQEERNALIKKIIQQSLEEEIDRAADLRRNRCLRCIRVRYVSKGGANHSDLPHGRELRAYKIGCVIEGQAPGIHCVHFSESSGGVSLGGYLEQMTLLYELREMFDEMDEIWEYLTK
ncbi:MAG: hypothetical protein H6Q48_3049 [Deltaproteobacteria bacterium]|nr:hypothetical protein [Deltaproteobacteria bacterium]